MKLISCLAMATSLSSLLSHEASALDIYAVKSTSQKIASISDADFAKNPTVYNTVDPNFSGMKAADYSGVSIEKIATLAKLSGDDVVNGHGVAKQEDLEMQRRARVKKLKPVHL